MSDLLNHLFSKSAFNIETLKRNAFQATTMGATHIRLSTETLDILLDNYPEVRYTGELNIFGLPVHFDHAVPFRVVEFVYPEQPYQGVV